MKKSAKSKFKTIKSLLRDNSRKLGKIDWIIIGVMVVVYSIISFINLGSFTNPQTFLEFQYSGEEASFTLAEAKEVSHIRMYAGSEIGSYDIFISSDGNNYEQATTVTQNSVFAWNDFQIDKNFQYLKIISKNEGSYIGEIQLYDNYGNKIELTAESETAKLLIDEKDTVPATISYLNSTYFDEIYFARSAYEYVHGIPTVEWVHPPLGKLIMAIPVLLFGMSTFAYRLMGNIAGILMIPVIYALAKNLFKNRKWAILAGLLMMFDCFHFAQTRMGTVDSFLVLFIMLSALFMYKYIVLENDAKLKTKLVNLFLSGLFIGCAIATKWTGFYAGLALAIVFFANIIYRNVGKGKEKDKDLGKIILSCFVFFVGIPLLIYVLSYLLFPIVYPGKVEGISGLIKQTQDMYTYHSTLEATHPFTSEWYTWPAMVKPVWYYVGYFGGGMKGTIVGIGNPAIWWFGIIASIFVLIMALLRRKREDWFILVFILATWLPYVFIGRIMFMYHYFPTLPFIVLAIVALIKFITEKIRNNSVYLFYVGVVILLFTYFYPVISGMITSEKYIETIRWLSSWYF